MNALILWCENRFVPNAVRDSIEKTIYENMRNLMRQKDLKRKWMLRRRRHWHQRKQRPRYQRSPPPQRRHSSIRTHKIHTIIMDRAWWQRPHQKTFSSNCNNSKRTPATVKRSFYKWVELIECISNLFLRISIMLLGPNFLYGNNEISKQWRFPSYWLEFFLILKMKHCFGLGQSH